MAFSAGTVSIATSATQILALNTSQKKRLITNVGSATIFIGSNNSVTTSNGFPLLVGENLNIGDFNGTVYGIVASGSEDLDFLEDE